jgi:hypothetical protein
VARTAAVAQQHQPRPVFLAGRHVQVAEVRTADGATLVQFLVLADRDELAAVVAVYVRLGRVALESVAWLQAFFAGFGAHQRAIGLGVSRSAYVGCYEGTRFLAASGLGGILPTSSSAPPSASPTLLDLLLLFFLHHENVCQILQINLWPPRPALLRIDGQPFCGRPRLCRLRRMWLRYSGVFFLPIDDGAYVSGAEAKDIGLLILISALLLRVVAKIVIDDGGEGSISGGRGQLLPADDALPLLLVDQQRQARPTEPVVARLHDDRVHHDLSTVRASYLFLHRRNELLNLSISLLLLLGSMRRIDEVEPKAYGLPLRHLADRQQPDLVSVLQFHLVVLPNLLGVMVGPICAQIRQQHNPTLCLFQHAVPSTQSLLV